MDELHELAQNPLLQAAAAAAGVDRAEATMASQGRQWAAYYAGLRAGGLPERLAQRLLDRQHATTCALVQLQAATQLAQAQNAE